MPIYRIYRMSPFSGHIERRTEFEAADDPAAIDRVAGEAGEQPLELWCGERKVARFETQPDMPPPAR